MEDDAPLPPRIIVLAGTNGAGKSSVAGAAFRAGGAKYFNPDEATRRIRAANPGLSEADANSAAWHQGRRLLGRAIAERLDFNFETTLGGRTITRLLGEAAGAGLDVRIWYAGLEGVALHRERVRIRVARGGHAIPDEKIAERYETSRLNLIRLLPDLAELRVFDNSTPADPATGAPRLVLELHVEHGAVRHVMAPDLVPTWAKPIVLAAFKLQRG